MVGSGADEENVRVWEGEVGERGGSRPDFPSAPHKSPPGLGSNKWIGATLYQLLLFMQFSQGSRHGPPGNARLSLDVREA